LAKVVVIDDDGVRRATLVDLLVGQNHHVRAASNAAAAVEAHLAQPADFVIASGAFGGVAGVGLAEQLQKPPRPADVILVYGEADAAVEGLAALRGIRLRGCLPWPPDLARLTALLRPAASVDTAAPGDWSGAGFLESVRGPLERVPIPRLLFLAHRVDASGAVVWQRPDGQARVFVRSGRVLQVDGVPCLFDTLDLPASSPQDLVGGVAAAVGAGTPFPNVLEAVSVALAGWLVDHEGREGGTVWFDPHAQAPPGAFALPTPIPRLLASGLRQTRTTAALARQWSARSHASLAVRAPDDAPEGRWGLDATSMRLLKLAAGSVDVAHLLGLAVAGQSEREPEVLRSLELLYLLGLLRVDGGALPAEQEPPPARRPAEAATPRVPGPPTQEDPHVARLRAALSTMEGAHPLDILLLGDRPTVTEAEVQRAYREVSKRYHPDTFFNSAPVVRTLAEACFAKLNAAYESLVAPGSLAEAQRFLASRQAGRGFATGRQQQAARVAFKRAETLFKNRDWRGADELFVEAARLDADTWPHRFHAIRCGVLSHRLRLSEAVPQLDALEPPSPARRADVLVAIGNLLKLEGQHDAALRRYKQALDVDPQNHDAQRELRLHRSREEKKATNSDAPRTAAAAFSGFFSRFGERK
jgi:curved DNA-binding protein CbpA/CheY-like chemotaxis protein